MSAPRGWIVVIALAGLNACTLADRVAAPPEPVATPAAAARSAADELVAYLARIRTMSDGALGAEAARHKRDASDLARVKAALALSLILQSEEGDILALVDPAAKKENVDPDVRAMASFLQTLATERRRLKESAATAGARLRDERRAHEAQKQRAEALQQKLDALTSLEKSLADRQNPTR